MQYKRRSTTIRSTGLVPDIIYVNYSETSYRASRFNHHCLFQTYHTGKLTLCLGKLFVVFTIVFMIRSNIAFIINMQTIRSIIETYGIICISDIITYRFIKLEHKIHLIEFYIYTTIFFLILQYFISYFFLNSCIISKLLLIFLKMNLLHLKKHMRTLKNMI